MNFLVKEMEELEKEFNKPRTLSVSDLKKNSEPQNSKPKTDYMLIDSNVRLSELEHRVFELERNFAVFSKNWNDLRNIIDKKLEGLKEIKEKRVDETPKKDISGELMTELSSLKEIVSRLSSENEELKRKLEETRTITPESLTDIHSKISSFENKLNEVQEQVRKSHWSRPVVLE